MRLIVMSVFALFLAFVCEHWPIAPKFYWLLPQWVALTVIFLSLTVPMLSRIALAIPVGLLMDVEHLLPLGTHMIAFSLLIYLVHLLRSRLYMLNIVQQIMVMFLLVASYQIVLLLTQMLMMEYVIPNNIVVSACVSALMWPWWRVLLKTLFQRVPV